MKHARLLPYDKELILLFQGWDQSIKEVLSQSVFE
jgi:hypothetical protein